MLVFQSFPPENLVLRGDSRGQGVRRIVLTASEVPLGKFASGFV